MSGHEKILKRIFKTLDYSMGIFHDEIDSFVENIHISFKGKDYSGNYLELLKMGFHLEIFLPQLNPTSTEYKTLKFLKEKYIVKSAEQMQADAHEFYHLLKKIALSKEKESPEVITYSSVEDLVNKVL